MHPRLFTWSAKNIFFTERENSLKKYKKNEKSSFSGQIIGSLAQKFDNFVLEWLRRNVHSEFSFFCGGRRY